MTTTEHAIAIQELQSLSQWVLWDSQKQPHNARTGALAESNDHSTWSSYEQARIALQTYKQCKGMGFMFNPTTGIMGIDLDHCINERGEIDEWAQEIVTLLDSYTEISQSGEGLHIFVRGATPDHKGIRRILKGQRHEKAAIEAYCKGRYFAMTFDQLPGTSNSMEARQDEIEKILSLYAPKPKNVTPAYHVPTIPTLSDSQLIDRACETNSKFKALFYGDWSQYGSQSEADIALCMMLAFWTGKDENRIDQLFRQSGLMREKWERDDYRGQTIQRACDLTVETYNPTRRHDQLIEDVLQLINDTQALQAPKQAPKQEKKKRKVHQLQPIAIEEKRILECLDMNEYGDAMLFSLIFEGQVCYDHDGKEWYLWAGNYWRKDTRSQIKQLVSGVLGTVYLKCNAELNTTLAEVTGEIERLSATGIDGITEADPLKDKVKTIKSSMSKLSTRARDLRGAKRCSNVQSFIQSFMGITSDMWDAHTMLLPTPDGVIDLTDGTFRPGEPGDYIRIVAPTEWQGLQAQCPRFLQFLDEIFADRSNEERTELINFLQRLLGYCITGLTTHHIFPLLFGEEGRNGKDTLLKALVAVLGPLVGACSNDVFIAGDRQRAAGAATPHLCDLQGKRMVWGSETKQGDRLNVAQVKQLTGGGEISARQNFGRQYKFAPTHKLLLMTNYKPHADAKDKAFWSRACLIEFNLRFVDKPLAFNERKADHSLDKSLASEASGILAWLVQGCIDQQEQGLEIPTSIQIATEKYRDDEDRVLHFIEECCVLLENATVGAGRLYTAYVQHCKENNIKPMDGKLFGLDISKRFERKRMTRGVVYMGIGLLNNDPTSPDDDHNVGSSVQNVGSMYGESHPTSPHEAASQASLADSHNPENVGYVGRNQKVVTYAYPNVNTLCFHPTYPTYNDVKNIPETASQADVAPYIKENDPTLTLHSEYATPAMVDLRKMWEQLKALPIVGPLGFTVWTLGEGGFSRGNVTKAEYLTRLATMIKSGDLQQMQSAKSEMERRLPQD